MSGWDPRWQENTCPVCGRAFTVTPTDDVMLPACGCFDDPVDHQWPCERCGLEHVYACLDKGPVPQRRLTAIVDETGRVVAQVEGEREGAALADEFIVRPDS